jgi:hypothetical protein
VTPVGANPGTQNQIQSDQIQSDQTQSDQIHPSSSNPPLESQQLNNQQLESGNMNSYAWPNESENLPDMDDIHTHPVHRPWSKQNIYGIAAKSPIKSGEDTQRNSQQSDGQQMQKDSGSCGSGSRGSGSHAKSVNDPDVDKFRISPAKMNSEAINVSGDSDIHEVNLQTLPAHRPWASPNVYGISDTSGYSVNDDDRVYGYGVAEGELLDYDYRQLHCVHDTNSISPNLNSSPDAPRMSPHAPQMSRHINQMSPHINHMQNQNNPTGNHPDWNQPDWNQPDHNQPMHTIPPAYTEPPVQTQPIQIHNCDVRDSPRLCRLDDSPLHKPGVYRSRDPSYHKPDYPNNTVLIGDAEFLTPYVNHSCTNQTNVKNQTNVNDGDGNGNDVDPNDVDPNDSISNTDRNRNGKNPAFVGLNMHKPLPHDQQPGPSILKNSPSRNDSRNGKGRGKGMSGGSVEAGRLGTGKVSSSSGSSSSISITSSESSSSSSSEDSHGVKREASGPAAGTRPEVSTPKVISPKVTGAEMKAAFDAQEAIPLEDILAEKENIAILSSPLASNDNIRASMPLALNLKPSSPLVGNLKASSPQPNSPSLSLKLSLPDIDRDEVLDNIKNRSPSDTSPQFKEKASSPMNKRSLSPGSPMNKRSLSPTSPILRNQSPQSPTSPTLRNHSPQSPTSRPLRRTSSIGSQSPNNSPKAMANNNNAKPNPMWYNTNNGLADDNNALSGDDNKATGVENGDHDALKPGAGNEDVDEDVNDAKGNEEGTASENIATDNTGISENAPNDNTANTATNATETNANATDPTANPATKSSPRVGLVTTAAGATLNIPGGATLTVARGTTATEVAETGNRKMTTWYPNAGNNIGIRMLTLSTTTY